MKTFLLLLLLLLACAVQAQTHGKLLIAPDPDPSVERTTYIALPTDEDCLDVLGTEVDTLTGGAMFETEALFWNAQSFVFNNTCDTGVVVSVVGSRHIVVNGRASWRPRKESPAKYWPPYFQREAK